MIKIFHTGDLHLDSPIKNGDIERSERARERLRALFLRMTEYIRTHAYDLVLISGDLYEHGYLTEETSMLIKKELGGLGCPVFISPGNHDPYIRGSLYRSGELPENVHVFGDEKLTSYALPSLGVTVYGYAFTSSSYRENPLAGADFSGDNSSIRLLCAHSEVGAPLSPYAPMSYGDIEACGFCYGALGHIHKAPEPYKSSALLCAYCGFGEGRAFDEIGEGSAVSLSIFEIGDKNELKMERPSFSEYSYEILPLDISGAENNADVIERICLALKEKGYGKRNAVRVILGGMTELGFEPNLRGILRNCEGIADLLEIKDRSIPLLGADYLEKDITVRGEFYRSMKKRILEGESERAKAVAAKALRIGLAALGDGELSSFLPLESNAERDESEA